MSHGKESSEHILQLYLVTLVTRYYSLSREGKKLLVLDIDYTLFDHRSTAETGVELMRPFLHEFLETAYAHYDIAIWYVC